MDFTGKTKAELRAMKLALQAHIRSLGGTVNANAEKARLTAEELKPFTDNIIAAKEAYNSKGFNVSITTNKNGLVTKWALKRTKGADAEKTLGYDEFTKVLGLLGNGEFSSKDINMALTNSDIGPRKLQPTLGLILRGVNAPSPIEKVPGTNKGPGVRYRKVK
jgi:hypothetical protein